MRFAFLIMGPFCPEQDAASIHAQAAQIVGVANLQQACAVAKQLCDDGVGCIELCGAFGPNGAKEIIQATGGKIPVGYVTHLPEQDEIYHQTFSKH